MTDLLGAEAAARQVVELDNSYDAGDFAQGRPVTAEVIRRFAQPLPVESDPQPILDTMKGLAEQWRQWSSVVEALQSTAALAAERALLEGDAG